MNAEKFNRFLKTNNFSYEGFAKVVGAGTISRASVHRLTINRAGKQFYESVKEPIKTAVAQKLRGNGLSDGEINTEIYEIFGEKLDEMITTRNRLTEDVLTHFKLTKDPFSLENDPKTCKEAFTTKEIERMARRVEDAINFQGFLCVLGAVGAGKSSLKQRVAEKFAANERVHLLFPKFVNMAKLNEGSIVHYLLKHFGLKPASRLALAQVQLEDHLAELNERGVRTAICFDECHRLSDDLLTTLKNFYEMGTGGYDRFLGLILFGQPQFKHRLERAEFREITERLEVLDMPPIARHAGDYLAHKIALAGGNIDSLFEKRAVELLAEQVSTPLALGNLAAKALLTTYEKGESKVIARFIEGNTKTNGLRRVS